MNGTPEGEGPKFTAAGKLVIVAIVAASLYGAYFFLYGNGKVPSWFPGTPTDGSSATSTEPRPSAGQVEIGIAYGTEKKRWFEAALKAFAETRDGADIKVTLIPKGSLEAAQEILRGDEAAKRIDVWSPASSLYRANFEQEWQVQHGTSPILKQEALALSPMVFVFWDERYQAFAQKYKAVSFDTIAQALAEKGGWDAIAAQPDWGFFKFGHTHPNKSNSGLMTLVLLGYSFQKKSRDLTLKDVLDVAFQKWMDGIERGVTGMSDSTGNMMREMVLKGPSSFDALFVYESVVIDYLKNAEGRWGRLHIEYPRYNAWNDNPYYILDVPWSSKAQRAAAEAFLQFLMSEPVQKQSLEHGFRPGNPSVPIKFPESPFVQYEPFGLKIELGTICESPKAEVLSNLLLGWQRSQGSR